MVVEAMMAKILIGTKTNHYVNVVVSYDTNG